MYILRPRDPSQFNNTVLLLISVNGVRGIAVEGRQITPYTKH